MAVTWTQNSLCGCFLSGVKGPPGEICLFYLHSGTIELGF